MRGLEPPASWITTRRSDRLSYTHHGRWWPTGGGRVGDGGRTRILRGHIPAISQLIFAHSAGGQQRVGRLDRQAHTCGPARRPPANHTGSCGDLAGGRIGHHRRPSVRDGRCPCGVLCAVLKELGLVSDAKREGRWLAALPGVCGASEAQTTFWTARDSRTWNVSFPPLIT